MSNNEQTIFIVDDEEVVRKTLGLILEQTGCLVRAFGSAGEFLEYFDGSQRGCLVSDVRMPGMDGMQLLQRLADRNLRIPVIMLSGHGDIPMAVAAVKMGAVDFLEKPADPNTLRQKVLKALELDTRWRQGQDERQEVEELMSRLTPREKEVLQLLVDGKNAKIIATILGSSHNTVRVQRASVMNKLRADNVADLIRMVTLTESNG